MARASAVSIGEVNTSVREMNVTLNEVAEAVRGLPARIRPIRSLIPTMGANTANGITVSASSVHWNQNLQPYKAFNKVFTSWREAFCLDARTGTLDINFPSAVTVTTYKIWGGHWGPQGGGNTGYAPKNFRFQGRNGAGAWSDLDTQRNQRTQSRPWNNRRYVNFDLAQPATFSQFRILIEGQNPANPQMSLSCIQEMELMGYAAADATVEEVSLCDRPDYFSNCDAAARNGCTRNGYYVLETDGYKWQTNCHIRDDGGWTEFAYLKWNYRENCASSQTLYLLYPSRPRPCLSRSPSFSCAPALFLSRALFPISIPRTHIRYRA